MTRTMRERIISTTFSIGLLFVGGLFSHFFWVKETNTVTLNQKIESLEKDKADKVELEKFKEENKDMHKADKDDREKDNAAIIEAIESQGRATREWIDIALKKNK